MNPKNIEIRECHCPFCDNDLKMNIKSFANHTRWCQKRPDYNDILEGTKQKLKKFYNEQNISKYGEIKEFNVCCKTCNKNFTVKEEEKLFPKRDRYYCCRSCANSHKVTDEHKKKVTESINNWLKAQGKFRETIIKQCLFCQSEFSTKNKNQKFCSSDCGHKHRTQEALKKKEGLEKYRKECEFRFNIFDYPDEFDLDLIQKYGIYKAKNRGDNPNGVDRDHMFSVYEGYKQNIDPEIIRHPANCRLMLHKDNVSKYTKCLITLGELLIKIEQWNRKYKGSNAIKINTRDVHWWLTSSRER